VEFALREKSPFLLRTLLLDEADTSERADLALLDASRGAANWQQPLILRAWHALGIYAAAAAPSPNGHGGIVLSLRPEDDHMAQFEAFATQQEPGSPMAEGCQFLRRAFQWLAEGLLQQWSRDRIVFEFAEAVAGRAYPNPPTLEFVQPIITRFLSPLLFGGDDELAAQFEVIGCEGATTGIAQVAATLARNGLISAGDRVAMWWPTYEPLRDLVECQLGCEIVPIRRDPAAGWAAIPGELEKLLEPGVDAAITVSPGNPVPVTTDPGSLDALEAAVEANPELIIISDYVYAQFLDEPVPTEIGRLPRNTIGVYSVSKDFGLAGMRAGVVLMHRENMASRALARLDDRAAERLYCRRALEPCAMPLAERIVADSRGVSFTHMSGLSTSLQALISLCALCAMIEPDAAEYFGWVREALGARIEALYEGLGIPAPDWTRGPSSRYATIIDLQDVARARGGRELVAALEGHNPWKLMTYLAREWKVILTPGEGFGAGEWSLRACFPSIDVDQARELGRRISEAVASFAGG